MSLFNGFIGVGGSAASPDMDSEQLDYKLTWLEKHGGQPGQLKLLQPR